MTIHESILKQSHHSFWRNHNARIRVEVNKNVNHRINASTRINKWHHVTATDMSSIHNHKKYQKVEGRLAPRLDIWGQAKHMQRLSLSYLSRAPSRLALSLLHSIRPKSLVQKLSDKLWNHAAYSYALHLILWVWPEAFCKALMHQQQHQHGPPQEKKCEEHRIVQRIFVLAWLNRWIALWHSPTNTKK